MEIEPFETSAFTKRRTDKLAAVSRSPLQVLSSVFPPLAGFVLIAFVMKLLSSDQPSAAISGPVITPGVVLVTITVGMIFITPMVKRKKSGVSSTAVHSVPIPQVTEPHAQSNPVRTEQFARPMLDHRLSLDNRRPSLSPLASRLDTSTRWRTSTAPRHAPAPFVDDIYAAQKHEYSDQMPVWARKFEETLMMPRVITPLVNSLAESDRILTDVFGRFGFRLSHESSSTVGSQSPGVICLSDRFLPNPLSTDPAITAEWTKRQQLEALVNVPGFPKNCRDYVVGRITAWANRGGLRFGYRYDYKQQDDFPTDSHILAHVLFSSIDPGFAERYVVKASSTMNLMDEFQTLFSSMGNAFGSGHYSNRMVWLEQNTRSGAPLHFNIGTNQKVFGVAPGGGNMIEAICLFFFLLRRLSPSAQWVQLPHELRVSIEAAIGNVDLSGSLAGSLFHSGVTPKATAGALPDLFRDQ
jgi:hypothetical protein